MKLSDWRRMMQLMVLGLVLISCNACAGERPTLTDMHTTVSGTPLTQSYIWHDGERENRVWLNPQVVAEFNPGKAGQKAAIKADTGATELSLKHPQAGIRLWKMNNAGNTAVTGLQIINPVGRYSPVFHDGPSSTSTMRALPGNVIVQLDPSWSETRVKSWMDSHQLQVISKIPAGENIYLIKTNPGMETLDTANALYQTGEVKAAYPDWWQEVVTK